MISGSCGSRSGYVLTCSVVKSHRLTKGRDVTYATMRGSDGTSLSFVVVRTSVYRSRGKDVVDMANASILATVVKPRDAIANTSMFCDELADNHAVSFAPAFSFEKPKTPMKDPNYGAPWA